MAGQSVAEVLREKLAHLQEAQAICSDASKGFTLKKEIEATEAALARVSGAAQAGFEREIGQRLADLEVRLHAVVYSGSMAEVARDITVTGADLPGAPARTRYLLEVIVRDLYRREHPTAGLKSLLDMIQDLCAGPGPLGPRIAADLDYIQRNGDLIDQAQDGPVDTSERHRQAEVIVLMSINLAEWYLTDYLPGRAASREQAAAELPPPPNPYRGLLAFREEDAANYFGRETEAEDVLAALQRQPLVAVVGASGSGKSSLVQAGVLPHLRTAGDWAVASFRPRGRPLAELAQALVATWQDDPVKRLAQADELAGLWSAGKVPLIDAVCEVLRQTGKRRLLLIADQLEEVWTLGADPSEAQRFLDLLAAAVAAAVTPGGQPPALCLLLTLRADFLGHALGHRDLADALDRYPKKLLGPVTDAERLRAIICEPARRAGVQFEDLLVERILRDLAQLPGDETPGGGASLPLLEFTLEQLWGLQRERRLTHLGYEQLGGIERALSRHADAVYATFSEAERERVRHVLVQMVRPGEGTADTRQVTTRTQVRPENWPLVTRLADARLVVTGHDPVRDEDTAEPIHEALIQHWQPLREWLREDRAFRLWQNGLRQARAEWVRLDRDPDALLAGSRLVEAEERLVAQGERLGEDEAEYIRASMRRRADEAAARERLQRRIRIGLSLFLAAALLLAGLAGWQWWVAAKRGSALATSLQQEEHSRSQAERNAEEAVRKEKDARHNLGSVFLEKAERSVADRRFNEARLYALHALSNFDPQRAGAAKATSLLLSTPSYRLAFCSVSGAHHDRLVSAVSFSPDGQTLASASYDKTIRLWDRATGKETAVLTGHTEAVYDIAFSPDGRTLASGSADRTIRLWDRTTGKETTVFSGHSGGVGGVVFSPDGRTLASASEDETIRLWDLAIGKEMAVFVARARSVAFSPEGRVLVSGSDDNTIRLWDPATGKEMAVLTGHTGLVFSVAFSPDGRTLASGSEDNTIRLWDPATGKETGVLTGHTGEVFSVAFSPDGRTLASGSQDNTIRLWDLASGKETAVLLGHTAELSSVAFSPDGRTLASGSVDSTIRLWDLATGKAPAVLSGHTGGVSSIAFFPDGRTLASGSGDNTIRRWDLATGKETTVLTGHRASLGSVAFSPDGRTLASGSDDNESDDNTIRLWDLATGEETGVLRGHTASVGSVAFSPDGRTLASGSSDNTIRLWKLATGEETAVLSGHTDVVRSVVFSPDGRTLASGSDDKTTRLWDLATDATAVLTGHTEAVDRVAFSPDGQTLASGSRDKTIRLWDLATAKETAVLSGHMDVVRSVVFSPDGRTLASGSGDKTVRLWDLATGKETVVLPWYTDSVASVSFSPDGRTLASGSDDGTLRLWDLATEQDTSVLAGHTGSVTSVAFSPDGRTLASGAGDNTLRLWDLATTKEAPVLRGHAGSVSSVAFSPDGRTLASGSDDRTIRLWDLATGKETAVLTGHTAIVNSVAFSPDGRTLASGLVDNSIQLWDPATGKETAVLAGHTGFLESVVFSPDGRTLASGSSDSTIRLWDLATGKESAVLKPYRDAVYSVAFAPDGRTLASGSYDNNIRLWDPATSKEMAVLTGHTGLVFSVAFSPDGRTLASGSEDKTVRLWDLANGKETAVLTGHTDSVASVAFSPDGLTLATGSWDSTIRLWNLEVLHDPRSNEEQLEAAEGQYRVRLVDLQLQPVPPERNLYGVRPLAPQWSKSNPFYWLGAADAGDPAAMLQLGMIYDRADDPKRAGTWYRKAAEAGEPQGAERASLARQEAATLWKTLPEGDIDPKRYDWAIDLCNRVIALDPNHADAYFLRGIIFDEREDVHQAEADYRQVVSLDPAFSGAYGNLGRLLIAQGRLDEAMSFAKKAHELDPEDWEWVVNLGHIYLLTRDRKTAREYYDKTIALLPDEAALKSGPLAAFQFFIVKGWEVKACKEEAAWFRKRLAEKQSRTRAR